MAIKESELILNPDGSVYHIALSSEMVADHVILVGDPGRVKTVSARFDKIHFERQHREFITHTGEYKGKLVTVISTGIGTDNIDIVLNELDAAVNIDLKTREIKKNLRKLNLIRIGTSGSLQADIPVDAYVASTFGLGLDILLNYYELDHTDLEEELADAFEEHTQWPATLHLPVFVEGSKSLLKKALPFTKQGITATAPGFFGPQGRQLRLKPLVQDLNELLTDFHYQEHRITNFEMETSALYGLGRALGHNCITICAIIANRIKKEYSKNSQKSIETLIDLVLEEMIAK
ncbi:MAG: nucleoside phosphorylase [Bacteroidia bacterium]|nr:nucleoside phosphorylase [Bacteroidia bacterium]